MLSVLSPQPMCSWLAAGITAVSEWRPARQWESGQIPRAWELNQTVVEVWP